MRVVATKSIVEGFAALLDYDPDATADQNAKSMGESARNVVAGEVTQAVRDTTTEAGEVHVGDWIGLGAAGVRSIARLDCGREQPAARGPRKPRARVGHHHRGRGIDVGEHRAGSPSSSPTNYPQLERRGAPRGPAALPLLLRHRVSDSAAAPTPPVGRRPVSQLRHIGEKRADALASMGIENVFDLLTFYPRRYIDRTNALTSRT